MKYQQQILYVFPNNSTLVHTYHRCTTPDMVNVEYHLLPGEYQIPVNMVLKNLHNFSIVGIVGKSSLQVVLVSCVHSHVKNIRNILFKRCYHLQLQPYTYFTRGSFHVKSTKNLDLF